MIIMNYSFTHHINKKDVFQHVIHELLMWYGLEKNVENNDFSVLKSLKLLFFVTAASTELRENSLLKGVFDNFYAMPYGHVESDIYNYIRNGESKNDRYHITNSKTVINYSISMPNIDLSIKKRIQDSIFILKNLNYNIVFMNQFDLVELSHKWDSWKNNFHKNNYSNSIQISSEDIFRESKIYS